MPSETSAHDRALAITLGCTVLGIALDQAGSDALSWIAIGLAVFALLVLMPVGYWLDQQESADALR